MAWKASFTQGISSFKALRLDEALNHFSLALKEQGGDKQYIIYDSRAAVYEKLDMPKEALRDAKTVITLAKEQWHGYARSARLFLLARKFDASLKMADMALDRVKASNTARRAELNKLKDQIFEAQQQEEKHRRASQNQFEKLPIELLGEMFYLVVFNDVADLITILHICRHWRNAALSNPMLWDKLVLTSKSPARKLRLWLNQSKGRIRELHVRRDVASHVDWPFPELAQLPWDKLRVCSAFKWHVADYFEKARLMCSDDAVFSSLESFEVVESHIDNQFTTTSLWPLFKKAGVRALSLSRSMISWEQLSHLTTLTTLNIEYCSTGLQDLLPALKANTMLEKLIIHDYFNYRWDAETEATDLPNLYHLSFRGGWSSYLLEHLRLPSLEHLSIRDSLNLDAAIRPLFAHPVPLHLTHLTLHSSPIAPSVVLTLLRHAPALVQLGLISMPAGAYVIVNGLAGPRSPSLQTATGDESRVLCPLLTHLDVSYSQDVRTGPLVRLVRTRLPPASSDPDQGGGRVPVEPQKKCERILRLTLDGCEHVEVDWLSWFRKNVPSVSCVFQAKKKAKWVS